MTEKKSHRKARLLSTDDDSRSAVFLLTNGAVDRDGETVNPEGGDLSDYARNSVVMFNHDTETFPIGMMHKLDPHYDGGPEIWIDKVDDKPAMLGRVYFSKENPQGDLAFRMVREGSLKGGSISFLPSGHVGKNNEGGSHYDKWKLLEFSVCPVGSNPEALRMCLKRFKDAAGETDPAVVQWADRVAVALAKSLKAEDKAPLPGHAAPKPLDPNALKYRAGQRVYARRLLQVPEYPGSTKYHVFARPADSLKVLFDADAWKGQSLVLQNRDGEIREIPAGDVRKSADGEDAVDKGARQGDRVKVGDRIQGTFMGDHPISGVVTEVHMDTARGSFGTATVKLDRPFRRFPDENPPRTHLLMTVSSDQRIDDDSFQLKSLGGGTMKRRKLWTNANKGWVLKSDGPLSPEAEAELDGRGIDDVRVADDVPPDQEWVEEELQEPEAAEEKAGAGDFKDGDHVVFVSGPSAGSEGVVTDVGPRGVAVAIEEEHGTLHVTVPPEKLRKKSLKRKLWSNGSKAWLLKSDGPLDDAGRDELTERGFDDVRVEEAEPDGDEWQEAEEKAGKPSFKVGDAVEVTYSGGSGLPVLQPGKVVEATPTGRGQNRANRYRVDFGPKGILWADEDALEPASGDKSKSKSLDEGPPGKRALKRMIKAIEDETRDVEKAEVNDAAEASLKLLRRALKRAYGDDGEADLSEPEKKLKAALDDCVSAKVAKLMSEDGFSREAAAGAAYADCGEKSKATRRVLKRLRPHVFKAVGVEEPEPEEEKNHASSQEYADLYFRHIPEGQRNATSAAQMIQQLRDAAKRDPQLARMLDTLQKAADTEPPQEKAFYVVDDNGYAAEVYLNGPDKGKPSPHSDRASAERAAARQRFDAEVTDKLPPVHGGDKSKSKRLSKADRDLVKQALDYMTDAADKAPPYLAAGMRHHSASLKALVDEPEPKAEELAPADAERMELALKRLDAGFGKLAKTYHGATGRKL